MTATRTPIAELKTRNVVALSTELLTLRPELAGALSLAAFAHDGQHRKEIRDSVNYTDPYVIHPVRVALRLIRHLGDSASTELLQAALLHDVLEDAPARVAQFYLPENTGVPAGPVATKLATGELLEHFGPAVTSTVLAVTNTPGRAYSDRIAAVTKHSPEAVAVKAADLIDNAGSLGYMAPGKNRNKLAIKYEVPVIRMTTACRIHRMPSLARRLETVSDLLAGLAGI